jgi:hypothetical protein
MHVSATFFFYIYVFTYIAAKGQGTGACVYYLLSVCLRLCMLGGKRARANLGVCLCVHTNVLKQILLPNVYFDCLLFIYLYYRFIHYLLYYYYTLSHGLSLAVCAKKSVISYLSAYSTQSATPSPWQLLTLARALSLFFFSRANVGGHFLRGGDGRQGYFQERSLVQALGLFLLLWLFGGLRSEEGRILDRGLQLGVLGRPCGRGAR